MTAAGVSTIESQGYAEAASAKVVFFAAYDGGSCDWRGTPDQAIELKNAFDTVEFVSKACGLDGSQPDDILISLNGFAFEARHFFDNNTNLSGIRRGVFINLAELGAHLALSAPRPILVVAPGD